MNEPGQRMVLVQHQERRRHTIAKWPSIGQPNVGQKLLQWAVQLDSWLPHP
jgi:hypothetical protein